MYKMSSESPECVYELYFEVEKNLCTQLSITIKFYHSIL